MCSLCIWDVGPSVGTKGISKGLNEFRDSMLVLHQVLDVEKLTNMYQINTLH